MGTDNIKANHQVLFREYENIDLNLTRIATNLEDDGTVSCWMETDWNLSGGGKKELRWKGVTIFGAQIKDEKDQIMWGRLYMEPVQTKSQQKVSLVERLVTDAEIRHQKIKTSMDMA